MRSQEMCDTAVAVGHRVVDAFEPSNVVHDFNLTG